MAEETRCEFYAHGWNDSEQKNYMIYECENKENIGGKAGFDRDDGSRLSLDVFHTSRMYSWRELMSEIINLNPTFLKNSFILDFKSHFLFRQTSMFQ
jgi:hypothetical protein